MLHLTRYKNNLSRDRNQDGLSFRRRATTLWFFRKLFEARSETLRLSRGNRKITMTFVTETRRMSDGPYGSSSQKTCTANVIDLRVGRRVSKARQRNLYREDLVHCTLPSSEKSRVGFAKRSRSARRNHQRCAEPMFNIRWDRFDTYHGLENARKIRI